MGLKELLTELNDVSSQVDLKKYHLDKQKDQVTSSKSSVDKYQKQLEKLQNEIPQAQKKYEELVSKRNNLQNEYDQVKHKHNDILEKIEEEKANRNRELIDWIFSLDGFDDSMDLDEVKAKLINNYKVTGGGFSSNGSSGGSGGGTTKEKYVKVNDTSTPANLKSNSINNAQAVENDGHEKFRKKNMVAINQDESNPIDTDVEVAQQNEFRRPMGNRNVNQEVKEYLSSKPKASSYPKKKDTGMEFGF